MATIIRKSSKQSIRRNVRLPKHVLDLFWEYDKSKISWETNRDLVIRKVLEDGKWLSVLWLLDKSRRRYIKKWLYDHRGGGIEVKKLCYWQLILNIPPDAVNAWIASYELDPWAHRWVI